MLDCNSLLLVSHKRHPGTLPQQHAGGSRCLKARYDDFLKKLLFTTVLRRPSLCLWLGVLCPHSLLSSSPGDWPATGLNMGSPSGGGEEEEFFC